MKVFITGVSRGIGRATALALRRAGHEVWGLSRRTPEPAPPGEPGLSRHIPCDLADAAARQQAAREMDAAGFVPGAVILNAAIEYEEPPTELAWDKMEAIWRTNVEGALFWVSHWMNRAPRPPMQFVAISSLLALWPDVNCPAYSASKAALNMAFRALRLRHRREKTAFKLLILGPVHTAINPRFTATANPPRGVATPEAVARFLVDHLLPGRRFLYYYPRPIGWICGFGRWIPDALFECVTRPFRR